MRRHGVSTENRGEMMAHALGQSARVHKDQRRAMMAGEIGNALVNLVPHFIRRYGAKLAAGHLDAQIKRPALRDVDDIGQRLIGSRQELRDELNWLLRGGKANSRGAGSGERVEPLERERQMRAALVVRHGVNLIDDHGLHRAQNLAALARRQQDVERFRSRHQNMRRPAEHRLALMHVRIAGAHGGANFRHQVTALLRQRNDLAKGYIEILLDVVAERLQRRDVENFSGVG